MRKKSLYLFLSWLVAAFLIFWVGMFRASEAPENKTRATWTETCTWIGATGGTWETASNWNCNSVNRVPTSTDQVVIDANVTVNVNATTTIDDLVLGDSAGTYSPILNFNYDAITGGALIIDESSAIIHPNSSVTHTLGTTVVVGRVFIDVQAGDLTINGTINVDAKGYAASEGPGQGTNGNGGGGAGYGGEGGNDAVSGNAGGITYGSLSAPTDLGSGGGIDGVGAKGGGAVKLNVVGTTTLAGAITAKGQPNPGVSTQDAGGGSGGSVYLITGTLAGAGTISVNGTDAYRYGGAGGGGRLAVYYTTDSSTISYQAFGGNIGSSGGNIAAAGTIYKKPSSGNASVTIDNTNRNAGVKKTGALTAAETFDTVTVTNYARLHLSTATTITTLNLSNNATLQVETAITTTYTTFNWTTGGVLIDRGGTFSLLSGGGSLTVPSSTYLYADTARSYTGITIDGYLRHSANTTAETYKIDQTVSGNYTISGTGNVNLDGAGFSANYGTGKGTGGNGGGGGGYGGEGGNGAVSNSGGSTYGSLTQPTNIGSGGGLDTATGNGKGGGAVKLNVTGTLTINGPISANGTSAITGTNDTGGGSGGSIYIIAGTLDGNSTLTANGGGGGAAGQYAGSGGGGRIAVYYTTNSSTVTATAKSGPTTGLTNVTGGAGTVYWESTGGVKSVTIDNGNLNHNYNYTYIPANLSLTTLTVTQKAALKYNVTGVSATTINLTSSGVFQLEAASSITYTTFNWTTASVLIDRGGTFTLLSGGGNLTVPSTTYLFADTARSYTSVVVDGILSHSANETTEVYKIDHTVSGSYTVSSTGSIDVSVKGYLPGYGPGVGGSGNGAGGGGHGGEGGDGAAAQGGTIYGSVTQPTTIGSGGGLDGVSYQGGGGAVKLNVSGTLTVTSPGYIAANGGTAIISTIDVGGGSGGSIYLIANTLSGNGTISANGGGGGNAGQYAGSGGGGRVALYYSTDSSTYTVTAKSGSTNSPTYVTAAAGTIYREVTAGTKSVLLDNGNLNCNDNYATLPVGLVVDSITVTNKGSLKSNSATVTATSLTFSNSGSLRTEVGGNLSYTSLSWGTSSWIIDRGGTFALLSGGGALTVPETTTLYADIARSFSSLTVDGVFTHTANTTAETYVILYTISGNVTVNASGSINVSYKGYQYSAGPGQGGDSSSGSGGGGYGGAGGNGTVGLGGVAYGSATNPTNIGSGGGNYVAGRGGSGGGAVTLNVTGTTTVDGSILADGANHIVDAAGGSGGTINIVTGTFAGSGTVYARGGTGDPAQSGGGGGGRIAIAYSGWTWTGNTMTDAVATAGGTGKNAGSIGTVYLYSSNNLPSASSVSIDSGATGINLTAGTSTSVSCAATITDLDGYLDITTVAATLFRTSVGYSAVDNDNNHYSATCSGGTGSGTTRPYTCSFDVWFHTEGTDANSSYPTDDWTCRVTPNDGDGEGTSATDTIEMNSLSAVSISSNIVFSGGYSPGTNSGAANEVTDIYNAGNVAIDIEIYGNNLCTDFPTCSGSTITVGNLEHYDIAFTYGAGLDLTTSPVLNSYNIARSTVHPSTQYRTVYWGIGIPALLSGGNYTGQVQFTAVQH